MVDGAEKQVLSTHVTDDFACGDKGYYIYRIEHASQHCTETGCGE
jgi:hypothetical protein